MTTEDIEVVRNQDGTVSINVKIHKLRCVNSCLRQVGLNNYVMMILQALRMMLSEDALT